MSFRRSIRKFLDACESGAHEWKLWGSGRPTRDFLFARKMRQSRRLSRPHKRSQAFETVNIGSGAEIAIRDVAERIAILTVFQGAVKWDQTQPDGQERRCVDTRRAEREFGSLARTRLTRSAALSGIWETNSQVTEAVGCR